MRISVYLFLLNFIFSCKTTKQSTKVINLDTLEIVSSKKAGDYRAAYTSYFDLIHTTLDLNFDWKQNHENGKAIIFLHPHFYSQDSLNLNARGMDIHDIRVIPFAIANPARQYTTSQELFHSTKNAKTLTYAYDKNFIHIKLDRTYKKEDTLIIYIDYTAKPDDLPAGGSAAITKDKGLYFINSDGTNPDKPRQLWTQGETESNSAWFPTIEDPQQKMTQEIYLTVESHFTTISNGLLISTTDNYNGTKTDYWKQTLPAAPYLTMIAVSDFAVVKDKWKNKSDPGSKEIEVSYYLDKDYEKYARLIFGNTPDMIQYFSDLLNVPFVWEKYAQVVVHDYVSGAMENTTAVIHGTNMLEDSSEYLDANYEDYISHELFHHWFGDLVTCESWSNLTLNEGFANYAEYLWQEHSKGRDAADQLNNADQFVYLMTAKMSDPELIRYYYEDREDMYDAVSYNKGGRVLHMLRKYVGDLAFFTALHDYLEAHRFGSVEINDLRLAFEKVTGQDLNWFFNEWFLKPGHPIMTITHNWNDSTKTETLTVEQNQDLKKNPLYKIPLAVDIYHNGIKDRQQITIEKQKQDFHWSYSTKPELVNFDGERMLLCDCKNDKSKDEYVFQFYHAPLYMDRYEALNKTGTTYEANSPEGNMMEDALNDPYWNIRLQALRNITEQLKANKERIKPRLLALALKDEKPQVRSQALKTLNKYFKADADFKAAVENKLSDSSNIVKAAAFKIVAENDKNKAEQIAKQYESSKSGDMLNAVATFYKEQGDPADNDFFLNAIDKTRRYDRFLLIDTYTGYLKKIDVKYWEKGIRKIGAIGAKVTANLGTTTIRNSLDRLQDEIESRLKDPNTDKNEINELTSMKQTLQEQINLLKKKQE